MFPMFLLHPMCSTQALPLLVLPPTCSQLSSWPQPRHLSSHSFPPKALNFTFFKYFFFCIFLLFSIPITLALSQVTWSLRWRATRVMWLTYGSSLGHACSSILYPPARMTFQMKGERVTQDPPAHFLKWFVRALKIETRLHNITCNRVP